MTRTLESPMDRRTTVIPRLGGVCRKLFGPVDHEQLSRDLSRQLRDMAERDALRWNFSFETNEPLPGRYRWESVPSERSASFYHHESATRGAATEEEEEEDDEEEEEEEDVAQRSSSRLFEEEQTEAACLDRENCSRVSNTLKLPCEVTPVAARRKRTGAHNMRTPQNNTHITDFFVKRRRSTDTRPLKSPLGFPSEQALCKGLR